MSQKRYINSIKLRGNSQEYISMKHERNKGVDRVVKEIYSQCKLRVDRKISKIYDKFIVKDPIKYANTEFDVEKLIDIIEMQNFDEKFNKSQVEIIEA